MKSCFEHVSIFIPAQKFTQSYTKMDYTISVWFEVIPPTNMQQPQTCGKHSINKGSQANHIQISSHIFIFMVVIGTFCCVKIVYTENNSRQEVVVKIFLNGYKKFKYSLHCNVLVQV